MRLKSATKTHIDNHVEDVMRTKNEAFKSV